MKEETSCKLQVQPSWGSPQQRLARGFFVLFSGLRFLSKNSGLLVWLIVPLVINLWVFGLSLFYGASQFSVWISQLLGFLFSDPAGVFYWALYYLLIVIGFLIAAITSFFVSYLISSVVNSPFNSILAEKVMERVGAIEPTPFQFGEWLKTSSKMFLISLVKLVVFVVLGLILFVISYIPMVAFLGAFFAMLLVSFDLADYGFEAKGLELFERFHAARSLKYEFSGIALFLGLTGLVPGLTLVLLPFLILGINELIARRWLSLGSAKKSRLS